MDEDFFNVSGTTVNHSISQSTLSVAAMAGELFNMSGTTVNHSTYFDDLPADYRVNGTWSTDVGSTFWLDDHCTAFEFFFNTVVIGAICLFGIATNLLSILVLRRDRQNQVATFLLCSLAVADICVLLVVFVVLSIFLGASRIPGVYIEYTRFAIPFLKKYVNPMGYMTQCATVWITVLVAFNRYIAIVHPFHAYRFLTIRFARIQVAVVFILSILFNVPRIFQVDIHYKLDPYNVTVPHSVPTEMEHSKSYQMGYLIGFITFVLLILPLIALVVFNAVIIVKLQISRRNMRQNSLNYIGSQEKNITIVIIVIVMVVVLCHTPDRVLVVFKVFQTSADNDQAMYCPHPLVYTSHVCNLLIVINSSTNFIVYCACRRRFRGILYQQFWRLVHSERCCAGRNRKWSDRRTSDVSSVANGRRHSAGQRVRTPRFSFDVYDSNGKKSSPNNFVPIGRSSSAPAAVTVHRQSSVTAPLLLDVSPTIVDGQSSPDATVVTFVPTPSQQLVNGGYCRSESGKTSFSLWSEGDSIERSLKPSLDGDVVVHLVANSGEHPLSVSSGDDTFKPEIAYHSTESIMNDDDSGLRTPLKNGELSILTTDTFRPSDLSNRTSDDVIGMTDLQCPVYVQCAPSAAADIPPAVDVSRC